ncbi:MAG: helix-turn-helix transcriptional regulator, partial [Anaerolineae bacterium]|nr:helix-turn-helix transcriptional regulator [Anaerolineae bacterium]
MDDPNRLLPLSPAVFHILLVLADGELHGYGIMQQIAQMTNSAVNIGPGTLYRSIKQMIYQNLIVEADERVDAKLSDERRRYYRLTEYGQRV